MLLVVSIGLKENRRVGQLSGIVLVPLGVVGLHYTPVDAKGFAQALCHRPSALLVDGTFEAHRGEEGLIP